MPGTVEGPVLRRRLAARWRSSSGRLTCFVWVFVTFFAFFKIVEALMGNRVSAEVEIEGLDIPGDGRARLSRLRAGTVDAGGGTTRRHGGSCCRATRCSVEAAFRDEDAAKL